MEMEALLAFCSTDLRPWILLIWTRPCPLDQNAPQPPEWSAGKSAWIVGLCRALLKSPSHLLVTKSYLRQMAKKNGEEQRITFGKPAVLAQR